VLGAALLVTTPARSRSATAIGDPVIGAAGDISCPSSTPRSTTCRQQATSDLLVDGSVDAVLPLGDNQYESGALSDYEAYYDPSWGRVKAITYPNPGNHEYMTPGAAGYYSYFGASAGDPSKGYYSFDLGEWHIISLNSNCSNIGGCQAGSPEEQWLRSDLSAHSNACTLAYWHHPLFTSAARGGTPEVQDLWRALFDYRADVILNGHEHDYERFGPQTPDGQTDSNGIREFVVGTGGKSHDALGTPIANSVVRDTRTFGILKMTLHASSYDWQFVPEAGGSFTDSGTAPCVRIPTNLTPPTVVGVAQQGQTMTAQPGTWEGDDPITYEYQWQRCDHVGQIKQDAPAAWWRLGESSGTQAMDSSSSNRTGSYHGSVALSQPGAPGTDSDTAASLDGATAWMDAPSLGVSSGPFSLETWMYARGPGTSGATAFGALFGTLSSFTRRVLWRASDGRLLAQFDGNFLSTFSATAGAWHLIDYVFDGTQERFYIDGQVAGVHATTLPAWPGSFRVGVNGDGVNYLFNGVLDEVGVYRTALSASRVAAHYNACGDIPGAGASTYGLTTADIGHTMRVRVIATGPGGSTMAFSGHSEAVAAPPPAPTNLTPPTIIGVAQQGQTLTADPGTWDGVPPVDYSFQWQHCGYAGQVRADAPLAWWRLGEASGSIAANESAGGGGGAAGYQGGIVLGQPGAPGTAPDAAASFDGSSGYVSAPPLGITSGPFTLETWAYLRGPGTTGENAFTALFAQDGSYSRRVLWRLSDGKLLAQFDGNFVSTRSAGLNAWHHIVYEFDGTAERFYIDGEAAGTHATTSPTWSSSFRLGINGTGAHYLLNGTMDEPAVYSTALSQARIRAHVVGCSDIPGAVQSDYTAAATDIGQTLRVAVTATNVGGSSSALSAPTEPIRSPLV
jgi:hypothetical protein